MIEAPQIDLAYPLTDGDIAVNNLESARRSSWSRFWRDPLRPGIAESIVEHEQLTAQFVGDLAALDRLDTLVEHLDRVGVESPRTALIHAQVSSMAHRFAEARVYLEAAADCAELSDTANRLSLSIDQACGTNLEVALEARRWIAAKSKRLEDLVPLAALHAELREFDEADKIYQCALREYHDTSPFAFAWVCFQLGALWGELVPEAHSSRAEYWYQKAIEHLPCYVKARVHLAEIYLRCDLAGKAEGLLIPAVLSGDPEVSWRLADVLIAMGRSVEAQELMQAARSGFKALLEKHLLAFSDHGAAFYAGSGNDPRRAFELASINLANRPTLRAFEQAYGASVAAGESERAAKIVAAAEDRWGATKAFRFSQLARTYGDKPASERATA